jgi:hypothetical protein
MSDLATHLVGKARDELSRALRTAETPIIPFKRTYALFMWFFTKY